MGILFKGFIILTILIASLLAIVVLTPVGGDVTGLDPDQYWEERCIDVAQYKAQGYSLDHIDEHGCEIVVKSIPHPTTRLKTAGTACGCQSGCSWGGNDCQEYGGNWIRVGCYGTQGICAPLIPDYKGGFERVINTCQFDQNDLLVVESFAGGQSIKKTDLRYPPKGFCKAHPAIFTEDITKKTITSTNVYDDLQNGKNIEIPSTATLTLFSILEDNYDLPTTCDRSKKQAVDVNNELCYSSIAFTYLCSEGTWDNIVGACVTQAEKECDGRWDIQLKLCIKNEPINVDCGVGRYFSVDRKLCIGKPKKEYYCPDAYTFVEPGRQEECEGIWDKCPQCPSDQICADGVCEPQCSTGQKCVWSNPIQIVCTNITASGICNVNETSSFELCPDEENYNDNTGECERDAESRLVCEDGSQPIISKITGKQECQSEPEGYVNCGDNMIWDGEKCTDKIKVYDPKTGKFIDYRQYDAGCTTDSDCKAIEESLICNENTGICYTNLYKNIIFTSDETIQAKPSLINPVSVILTTALLISIIIIIGLVVRKKR